MSRSFRRWSSILIALLAVVAPSASAQIAGSLDATLQVVYAVQVTGRNLAFGTIPATGSAVVAPTSAAAGEFTIGGPVGAQVAFTIKTLPANFGPSSLKITNWQGRHSWIEFPFWGTAFTPTQGYSTTFTIGFFGEYYVWLGATVTATNAPGGTYSTPIVVQVTYL